MAAGPASWPATGNGEEKSLYARWLKETDFPYEVVMTLKRLVDDFWRAVSDWRPA
jgi:hypothetical protein